MFQRHGVSSERIDVLRQVPFFEGLSNKHLARIDQHLDEVNVDAGKVLTAQGEGAYEAFIIADGVAVISSVDPILGEVDR